LTPWITAPLINENFIRLKGSDGVLPLIKQLYTDPIFSSIIRMWGIPADKTSKRYGSVLKLCFHILEPDLTLIPCSLNESDNALFVLVNINVQGLNENFVIYFYKGI